MHEEYISTPDQSNYATCLCFCELLRSKFPLKNFCRRKGAALLNRTDVGIMTSATVFYVIVKRVRLVEGTDHYEFEHLPGTAFRWADTVHCRVWVDDS